jgi:hypothetical protein
MVLKRFIMVHELDVKNYVVNNVGRSLNAKEVRVLYDLIDLMNTNYSKKDILNSFKFNLNFIEKNKLKELTLGKNEKFKVSRANPFENLHSESIIEYQISYNKNTISTFGIYFTIDSSRKITLRISNIQGYIGNNLNNNRAELLDKNRVYIDKLNKELKENWRVKVVSLLKNYAEKNKYNIILELPLKTTYTTSQYQRQLRQYIQAGLKAGLKLENISLDNIYREGSKKRTSKQDIELKLLKEKFEKNFEIKKKRLLDSKQNDFLKSRDSKKTFKPIKRK